MSTLLLVLVILLLLGAFGTLGGLPQLGWHSYGPRAPGLLTVVLVVVLIWLLMGRGG